jgi:hypothetical protein
MSDCDGWRRLSPPRSTLRCDLVGATGLRSSGSRATRCAPRTAASRAACVAEGATLAVSCCRLRASLRRTSPPRVVRGGAATDSVPVRALPRERSTARSRASRVSRGDGTNCAAGFGGAPGRRWNPRVDATADSRVATTGRLRWARGGRRARSAPPTTRAPSALTGSAPSTARIRSQRAEAPRDPATGPRAKRSRSTTTTPSRAREFW